ncbi:hypothetical protein E6H37_04920 [Candidatus Bathyarchaeota archaeon]|nr:MAG: hypothetical protein E6H37_04920 [Candidatus Bathyarchaeota archaeon]
MSQPKPRRGSSVVITILAAIMAVVGLYFIGLVFGGDITDPNIAILYVTIAVLAFTFVLLTVTRMRRGIRIGAYTPIKVLSIVKCGQCSFKQIKNFAMGDFVFKTLGKCTQCNTGDLSINGIYTEGPPKK